MNFLKRLLLDLSPPILTRFVSRYVMPRKHEPEPEKLVTVSTLTELDAWLRKAEAAGSEDAFRQVLAEFQFADVRELDPDPFSASYQAAQWELYKTISGRARYQATENEFAPFEFEVAQKCPFPYQTHSFAVAGEQLSMQGILCQKMPFSPVNANVLELGAGWGNLTLTLAQLGCRVTAVDVNPRFLELIDFRTKQIGYSVQLVCADMLEFTSRETYDAIVFFESFHHCWDHWQMLEKLHGLLKPDGVLIFGGEPIIEMVKPWGVRLDGMAVWSIRRFGWFELGFRPNYFMAALERYGWQAELYRSVDLPYYSVVTASHPAQQIEGLSSGHL